MIDSRDQSVSFERLAFVIAISILMTSPSMKLDYVLLGDPLYRLILK